MFVTNAAWLCTVFCLYCRLIYVLILIFAYVLISYVGMQKSIIDIDKNKVLARVGWQGCSWR